MFVCEKVSRLFDGNYRAAEFNADTVERTWVLGDLALRPPGREATREDEVLRLMIYRRTVNCYIKWFFLAFGVLTHSRCKRENQNASNSAAFNEIATSQQLLLSRLPLGFAAFDQRPCFLPDTRSWRFMPAPKVRKTPKTEDEPRYLRMKP